jgi:hypothetical protein
MHPTSVADRVKAEADKLLRAGTITETEHAALCRAADKTKRGSDVAIEGKSARPRLDRPGLRRQKRADGGRVAELRAYQPTFRGRLAEALAPDERTSPERRRLVEALRGRQAQAARGSG